MTDASALRAELERARAENARLAAALATSHHEITEARSQQAATVDVLHAIAASPNDLQSILDAIVRQAVELSHADYALIQRWDGEYLERVATHFRAGADIARAGVQAIRRTGWRGSTATRGSAAGTAFLERRTIHISDALLTSETYPDTYRNAQVSDLRSVVAVPLLHGDHVLGILLVINFGEPRPFTERQTALLEAFASQAAIAMATSELFQRVKQQNVDLTESNRQVTEALEQQTALAEVLRVIASAPSDIDRILDVISETAARICGSDNAAIRLVDGDHFVRAANFGPRYSPRGERLPIDLNTPSGQVILTGRTRAIEDAQAIIEHEYPGRAAVYRRIGVRSAVIVPMLRDTEVIGTIVIQRLEVRPFTDREIALLETFADQAVIAIENARLFSELEQRNAELQESNHQVTEALEQQTALAEVLRVIASSPTDARHVLEAIAESAARVCGTDNALIRLVEGDQYVRAVHFGYAPVTPDKALPIDRDTLSGRAILDRRTWKADDVLAVAEQEFPTRGARYREVGLRSAVSVPMLRDDSVVGTIVLLRFELKPFTDREISLLETFADQAVIAIENARLFEELQATSRALAEASQHKSQFLANMSHELRTPLNAIIGYSEMLQEEAEDIAAEMLIPDLQKVNGAGKHLLGLINDILDLSKIEAGRMDLDLTTFDIGQLVRDVQAIVQPLVEKNGNTLVLDCPPDIGAIHADETKLRQTLFNLLSNAAKFTDHGTIQLRVERDEGREDRGNGRS